MSMMEQTKDEPEPLIKNAEADFETYTVTLSWQNGVRTQADFSKLVGRGVFEAFADAAFFTKVEVKFGGRVLSWAKGIDFDALSLWYGANEAMTPEKLKPFMPPKASNSFTPVSSLVPKAG